VKRLWTVSAFVVVLMLVAGGAFAAGKTYNGFPVANVNINGKDLAGNVPPITMGGQVVAPVKDVAALLGGDSWYSEPTQTLFVFSKSLSSALNNKVVTGNLLTLGVTDTRLTTPDVRQLLKTQELTRYAAVQLVSPTTFGAT